MENLMITMPRLGVNDEYVTLAEWLIENRSAVTEGQEIASIESTKETSEIKAEMGGYLFYQIREGTEVKVGDTVAVISQSPDFTFTVEKHETSSIKITDNAKQLIEKYNIDPSRLPSKKIIRERDVMTLVDNCEIIDRSKANDVIIIGGGGLAKMCIDLIRLNKAYNIHGFTDSNTSIGPVMGIPYLGTIDVLEGLRKSGFMTAVNAMGSVSNDNTTKKFSLRKKKYEIIKKHGYFMPTLIHPSAQIATSARLGEGTLVFENVTIGSEALIGDDCIINPGAIISHECKLANHARISPGAVLAGKVTIGENSLIGMNVTIYSGIRIGKNVIIANGQNIISNIPDNAIIK